MAKPKQCKDCEAKGERMATIMGTLKNHHMLPGARIAAVVILQEMFSDAAVLEDGSLSLAFHRDQMSEALGISQRDIDEALEMLGDCGAEIGSSATWPDGSPVTATCTRPIGPR